MAEKRNGDQYARVILLDQVVDYRFKQGAASQIAPKLDFEGAIGQMIIYVGVREYLERVGLTGALADLESKDIEYAEFELLRSNSLSLWNRVSGPYTMTIGSEEEAVTFSITNRHAEFLEVFVVERKLLRSHIEQYRSICERFEAARSSRSAEVVDALGVGRTSAHDEGGELIVELFKPKAEIDSSTGRKIFAVLALLPIF
jgi:uncharacterized protein (UPF0262 family)